MNECNSTLIPVDFGDTGAMVKIRIFALFENGLSAKIAETRVTTCTPAKLMYDNHHNILILPFGFAPTGRPMLVDADQGRPRC